MAMPGVAAASSGCIPGADGTYRIYDPNENPPGYAFEWVTPFLAGPPEKPSELEFATNETYEFSEINVIELRPQFFQPPGPGEYLLQWIVRDFNLVQEQTYSAQFDWEGNCYQVNFIWDPEN
jgi:hypothetical protein